MRKIVRRNRRSRCALMFAVTLFMSLVVSTGTANATSDYDSVVVTTGSLILDQTIDNVDCPARDISTTWNSILHKTNSDGFYNPYTVSTTDLDQAYENGVGWAAVQRETLDGTKYVAVYATPVYNKQAKFRTVGYAEIKELYVEYSRVYYIQYGEDCSSYYMDSSSPYNRSMAWSDSDAASYGATSHVFFANYSKEYPYDYNGEYMPSAYPLPPTTPYTGSIDCGGEDPQHLYIYQIENYGEAPLIYESLGRATWTYDLNDSLYSIAVDCDGTMGYAYGIVPSTGTNWVCDIYGDPPHYCVLG